MLLINIMASLHAIENLLKVDLLTKTRHEGMKNEEHNEYYHLPNRCYVVKLTGAERRWFIVDDSDESEKLLKRHVFHHVEDGSGAYTLTHNGFEYWGQIRMGYDVKHKSTNTYDNRLGNLKKITPIRIRVKEPLEAHNTSGYKGVTRHKMNWGAEYWIGWISVYDSDGVSRKITKSFNIAKFGEKRAKQYAINARFRLGKLYED
jgi:hypothetical protein